MSWYPLWLFGEMPLTGGSVSGGGHPWRSTAKTGAATAGSNAGGSFKMDYRDRHIVITGGAGALGTAVVRALLHAGAICHVPCRTNAEAEHFAWRGRSDVLLSVTGDLSEEAAVDQLFGRVTELWAAIHLAGGFAAGPAVKVSKAMLMEQLNKNIVTCFLCCRAAITAIARTGRGGRIVNVAARPALEWRAGAGMAAYTASKAAVAALTVALGEEVAPQQILVNAVAPSIIDTPTNRRDMPKAAFQKWPKVEEVAATIVFLGSPDNRVTRSAIVPVYGRS
jgi:NAD(P)-dependent dehydrogenase (short-subunit alcohol dehydrogenase family)